MSQIRAAISSGEDADECRTNIRGIFGRQLWTSELFGRKASAIIPLGATIGELALASSLFVYRMGKNLLIFQVMAANY